ncbi:MAG: restriction endonuclease [Acidobacteria bacterium]|nr:restriction endonuclease [Acidobacteriota bacterium]
MAIPDFQSLMLPLLRSLGDGAERSTQETLDALTRDLHLSDADVTQPMPSRSAPLFTNRVAWAKLHLKRAGLLDSPRRGVYRITEGGKELVRNPPPKLNLAYLSRFPEYVEFRNRSRAADDGDSGPDLNQEAERTPEEYIEYGYGRLRAALADEILSRVAQMPPAFFEKLVVDLLVAMGYGGSQRDAGRAVGPGADEGIDGVIKEDRLGLETIYIQAKRWQTTVGRPELQRFAGALQGQRARKGVFITTSNFSKEAEAYAASIQSTIVLVNGAQLAELMIDHGIGVALVNTYEIKRLDSDYFILE